MCTLTILSQPPLLMSHLRLPCCSTVCMYGGSVDLSDHLFEMVCVCVFTVVDGSRRSVDLGGHLFEMVCVFVDLDIDGVFLALAVMIKGCESSMAWHP
ncbi:hypothetical protein QVD17_28929 [Tagetes erecta]|uniref:Uncharacterized protein n=1 Tax=Tagetes erecta TaxID=13708 RepID=A0AAD8NSL8_TARER|nr:hypothetical protein QVD17_28929 [Tagetes erecta]